MVDLRSQLWGRWVGEDDRAGGAVKIHLLQRNPHDAPVQFNIFRNSCIAGLDEFLCDCPFVAGVHVTGQQPGNDTFPGIGVDAADKIYFFALHVLRV